MRRIIGLVLAGLGTFLIAIAILLPTWIGGQVVKYPLNEFETITLTAPSGSYFSPTALTQVSNLPLQVTYTVKGTGTGTSSTAVWKMFTYVYDPTNKQMVEAMNRTFAFNRKTAELVDCCGASVNGDTSVRQTGIVGYIFPFNTQKKTYLAFDTTLEKAMPFVYTGTASVNGIQTYEFTENVKPTYMGYSQLSSTQPEYYSAQTTYWVDPETGAMLKAAVREDTYLVNPATGATTTTLFGAHLTTTPDTVKTLVHLDSTGRTQILWLETILPIIIGVVGAIGVAAGFLLYRRKGDGTRSTPANQVGEFPGAEPATEPLVATERADGLAAPETAETDTRQPPTPW